MSAPGGGKRRALEEAYRRTRYCVEGGGAAIELAVGVPSPALDRLLAAKGADCGAIVTAANPRGKRCAPEENARANAALAARLDALGLKPLPHRAAAEDPSWDEPGFFVPGLDEARAVALAAEFGQYAVLLCPAGAAPRLAFTRLAPR